MSRDIILKTLGTNIRNARKQCNMTQKVLAEKMGVCKSTVEKWEGGASEIPLTKLVKMGNILDGSCLMREFCRFNCLEK